MIALCCTFLILSCSIQLYGINSFRHQILAGIRHNRLKTSSIHFETLQRRYCSFILFGKISKAEEQDQLQEQGILTGSGENDDRMTLPYTGLVGYEPQNLFYKPIDMFDPLKDTSDLPGADGSPEKIAAIQDRIKQRVAELEAAGQWDDDPDAGRNPLQSKPMIETMVDMLKVCQPFESLDEFVLTYILTAAMTIALSVYLLFLGDFLPPIMKAFVTADFDSEFLSNFINNLQSSG